MIDLEARETMKEAVAKLKTEILATISDYEKLEAENTALKKSLKFWIAEAADLKILLEKKEREE